MNKNVSHRQMKVWQLGDIKIFLHFYFGLGSMVDPSLVPNPDIYLGRPLLPTQE